ncbi:MAG: PHP domain-containing protein [Chloroflexi bacterium]|jgi:predicted metal-dependent phosphoesterase TrpH|nr:PHP domain-containing protein [Chloroflexota bacterium]
MATIDLHIHSNYSSDGEFPPAQLVEFCLAAGLTHAAVADHNTARAVDETLQAATGTPLIIIPAIEMNVVYNGLGLHMLGYGIDHHAEIFNEIAEDIRLQDQANSAKMLRLVRQLGIEFDDALIESLAVDGIVIAETIAEAALQFDAKGENPLLDPYRAGGHRSDNPYVNFYWDYCAQGKPAHVPVDYITLEQGLEVIRANHGVPILAHPGQQLNENKSLLEEIVAQGVDGLEVYSSYHTREQEHFYRDAALELGILMTCGSDFHGKTKKSILVGGTECEGQEAQIIDALLEKINRA